MSRVGYTVLPAPDGHTALSILDDDARVSLLFTDVVLPNKMSGAVLGEEVRRRHPGIKVVYTSGYNESIVGPDGVLADGVDLLSKPYRRETLARQLRAALDR